VVRSSWFFWPRRLEGTRVVINSKSQIANPKQIPSTEIPMFKTRLGQKPLPVCVNII